MKNKKIIYTIVRVLLPGWGRGSGEKRLGGERGGSYIAS